MTTIFAPITSVYKAGIAIVRISGKKALECLKVLGVKNLPQANQVKFAKIYDPRSGYLLDETLITFFASPNSFTGEDVVEISIHGSSYIIKKLLEILSQIADVRLAQAGEFSKRAFLNNKLDLVQAEAIVDLIACETEMQHKQALKQLQGHLGIIYENWRYQIIEISALIESGIDFPDEDLPQNLVDELLEKTEQLKKEINDHISDNKRGQKIKEGLSLAIIGSPNVGKSSLLNFLAKSEVAIVSDVAGTTRDVIEISLDLAGVAVKIADTAGLRQSDDKIEQEGIKRALNKASQADVKILLIDATKPVKHQAVVDDNTIIVFNKMDLIDDKNNDGYIALKSLKDLYPQAIEISLLNKNNVDFLIKKLEEKVLELIPSQHLPAITQERYRVALHNVLKNLENFSLEKNIEFAAEDLRQAGLELAQITGRINVDDILDVVFSRFCIGK